MNSFIYTIIFIYLLLLSFVNGFAYNSFITIPFFASLTFVFFYLNKVNRIRSIRSSASVLLFLYWLLFTCSFLVVSTGEKCLNQYLMWSYSFLVYYFFFKYLLIGYFKEEFVRSKILKALAFGVILTSLFVVFEFVSKNFLGLPIDNYIPRGKLDEMNSENLLGGVRCRGLTEESSHLGFYLLSLCPISFFWIIRYVKKKVMRLLLIFLICLSILFSFSSGAYAISLFTLLMYLNSYIKKHNVFINLIIIILLSTFVLSFYTDSIFFQTIAMKFDENSISGQDRWSRIEALNYLKDMHWVIGYGPAAYSTLRIPSFISLVVGVLMNTGIIGMILMILFMVSVYKDIRRIDDEFLRTSIKIAFLNCCLFFTFGDLIYVPWFWVVASLAATFGYFSQRNKFIKKRQKLI